MNIFVTDENPVICAKALDDLRLNKMITESAQMLSTAVLRCSDEFWKSNRDDKLIAQEMGLCKMTHLNHPCNKWARETRDNFLWLYSHYQAMAEEWCFRKKKIHNGFKKYAKNIITRFDRIPAGSQTDFVNCSGFKLETVFESYQACLSNKWKNDKRQPKWTNRICPSWFDGLLEG